MKILAFIFVIFILLYLLPKFIITYIQSLKFNDNLRSIIGNDEVDRLENELGGFWKAQSLNTLIPLKKVNLSNEQYIKIESNLEYQKYLRGVKLFLYFLIFFGCIMIILASLSYIYT